MPPKTYRRGVGIGATHSIKAGREPIQHASSGERRTRTGETYRALCGAAIYENRRETFDPTHQRACPKCVAGAARAAAGEPGDVTP